MLYATPPGQDQLARPGVDQPLCALQPQTAQPPSNQIAPIVVNCWRIGGDDRPGRHKARHIAFAAPIGDLLFKIRGRLEQFGQQVLGLCCGIIRHRQVDQATPQLAMLQRNHPSHAPKWALGCRHGFGGSNLLCPLGDHPQARP